MKLTTHTLTPLEEACGVTLEELSREIPRLLLRDDGSTLIVDGTLSPAMSNALARFTFGDDNYEFSHHNSQLNLTIYHSV